MRVIAVHRHAGGGVRFRAASTAVHASPTAAAAPPATRCGHITTGSRAHAVPVAVEARASARVALGIAAVEEAAGEVHAPHDSGAAPEHDVAV